MLSKRPIAKDKNLKVVACIQARLGSVRLKRKALRKILGKTIIEHIFSRLKAARQLDEIVLATSLNQENDNLVRHAQTIGLKYYRGSEEDLLARLYQTCLKFRADALVRITGDCPLVDPGLVDDLSRVFRRSPKKFDYLTNVFPRSFPDGLDIEIYPLATLELLDKKINKRSPYRGNFPSYVWENHKAFRIFNLKNKENLSSLRLTLDYPQDLRLISRVFTILGKNGKVFLMKEMIELLKQNPQLSQMNQKYALYQ